MVPVLLQSLILASGGILSVGSITIVILLLISDRGWRNGFAYVFGYVGTYTLIGLSVILSGYNAEATGSGETRIILPLLFVLLGILLLWITQRNWRRPSSDNSESPRLFAILDNITPIKAFAFGALVTVINFKNLAIFLSAVSVTLVSDLLLPSKIVIVILVVLVFCSSVLVPALIYVAFPKQAVKQLNWIKRTLENHRRPIGIWVPLIFGIIFLVRGIWGLL